jgi:hypothetical protein
LSKSWIELAASTIEATETNRRSVAVDHERHRAYRRRVASAKKTVKKPATKPAPKKKPAGFGTIDYGDGMHGLMLVGSGYAWESIGRHVAAQLKIADRLHFDCEGSMFVVRSTDTALLARLQAKLEPYRTDRDKFKRLIAKLGEA